MYEQFPLKSDLRPENAVVSALASANHHDGERVVAANVDQVVVVFAAAKPDPHPRMLDRFLVIAEGNALAARVVVNKVELVGEEAARARFAERQKQTELARKKGIVHIGAVQK